ncbi:MAG TPA: hypothetical protein VFN31_00465 [Candidatus Saccharimonadales bacterium]|nr:hypothetical protein [Candidatus Saccharimonadales bacterium]
MIQNKELATIRERNKRKRLAGWLMFYLLLIALFIYSIYGQTKQVNTLNFPNGTLQLTTTKSKYTVGDTISYTLRNGFKQPITLLNNCPNEPLYVYTWSNNAWVRIHDTANVSACNNTPKQQTIAPGASYSQNFNNWPNLFNKPGIYRIVGFATNYQAIPYADFKVVPKPVAPKVVTQTQVIIQKIITPVYVQVPVSSGGGDSGGGGGGDN